MKKIIVTVALLTALVFTLSGCGFTVPRPEIKSGEFNFSVTYEYAGETKTVTGVYVCEYAGTSWTLDGGYDRDWTGYIKGSDDNDHILLDTVEGGDEIILVLNLNADYFMDDFNFDLYGNPAPYIMIKDYTEEGFRILQDAADVERDYGAKVISYEYDAPVENTFKLFA